jgi:nickel-dependent lactate racemase
VDTGLLDGNAVHEAFMEAAAKVKPAFCVSTIVNDDGDAIDLFCGDWITSHRAACDAYAGKNAIEIAEKRDTVVVSCGGFPYDINVIQAHKALEAASHACSDGGTIILLAECGEGAGRGDFLDWFETVSSEALAEKLCQSYKVNGQTAWSLFAKTEKFDVRIVTRLNVEDVEKMKMKKASTLSDALPGSGYVIPFGAKNVIRLKS